MSNLYHCTVHKAASTWFRDLFRDPVVKRAHGMTVYHYETDLKRKTYENYCQQTRVTMPENTVVTNVYCSHSEFVRHIKGPSYKGFYIAKDPREIVISSYWSWRKSHIGGHPNRKLVNELSYEDGLQWTIDELDRKLGKFEAMRSWAAQPEPTFLYFKTEEFFADQDANLAALLEFLDISIAREEFAALCERFSFERLSGGRKPGEVDKTNHFRSGQTGTWREMPDEILDYFYETTGDLVEVLGYDR